MLPIFIENFEINLDLEIYILINKFYLKICTYFKVILNNLFCAITSAKI